MNEPTKPEIWVCLDKDGYPVFTAGWKEACHEHINDAVLHDKSAGKWVVRQVTVNPAKTESVLIENVAYTLPIEVACELLRLHIELKTAQKDAELMPLLKDARYELHACQAVIHLAGGFDPAYVSGAQKVLKAIDAVVAGMAT